MSLPPIQSFWLGDELGPIERLCVQSFIDHGHDFHLYAYDAPKGCPQRTTLRNAEMILPKTAVFRHHTGSLAVFADWFRYELLAQLGGWWVDMDMICLKQFAFSDANVIGMQQQGLLNNACMRFQSNHATLRRALDHVRHPYALRRGDSLLTCVRKAMSMLKGRTLRDVSWGSTGPMLITKVTDEHASNITILQPHVFYPVRFFEWKKLFDGSITLNCIQQQGSVAIHFWNEMLRRESTFSLSHATLDSAFKHLCKRHCIT